MKNVITGSNSNRLQSETTQVAAKRCQSKNASSESPTKKLSGAVCLGFEVQGKDYTNGADMVRRFNWTTST